MACLETVIARAPLAFVVGKMMMKSCAVNIFRGGKKMFSEKSYQGPFYHQVRVGTTNWHWAKKGRVYPNLWQIEWMLAGKNRDLIVGFSGYRTGQTEISSATSVSKMLKAPVSEQFAVSKLIS